MCSTRAAVLLLLFVISIPGEAVKFPVLFGEISDCVQRQCSEKIDACQERYGEALTGQLRDCIANNCKGAMVSCMDWIFQGIVAARRGANPQVSTEVLERQWEIVVGVIVNSYFHCFRLSGHQNTTEFLGCLLEGLLDKALPYVNMLSSLLGITESGVVSCWLKKALRQMVSCYSHVDEDYYTMLEDNMKRELALNRQEYFTCHDVLFQDKKCFQLYSRLFGSTPAMLTQTKGLFVCFINEAVLATVAC
ncbi:uncharacterized protein LOC118813983 isoform X2 [Colossoma macropomum]|uniref:uncharacterized protein LOC118813983 isoform X2 n=1 Tax=Colossoma macropomum TaxID=42526 RepID=UPI0018641352|nr:uncharacterized protein LOC118813983 isoform X2 [Colossoma macropomum]